MHRYDADHGYGTNGRVGRPGHAADYHPIAEGGGRDRRASPRSRRVVARYNEDYLRPVADPPLFNPNRFGADSNGRIQDRAGYRYPYITRGGTWTNRGSFRPYDRDLRGYGRAYGGRYPDEL